METRVLFCLLESKQKEEGRRKKEEGRRKKENAATVIVSTIKNVIRSAN
ncbi:hypothetical protein QUB08_06220 [Microcoleus sp. BR0-C5]